MSENDPRQYSSLSRLNLSRDQLREVGLQYARETGGWMSTEETCTYLGVQMDWLYAYVAKDDIPHAKIGRLLRFRRSEIDAWMEGNHRGPNVA